jgi:hypothetical protein
MRAAAVLLLIFLSYLCSSLLFSMSGVSWLRRLASQRNAPQEREGDGGESSSPLDDDECDRVLLLGDSLTEGYSGSFPSIVFHPYMRELARRFDRAVGGEGVPEHEKHEETSHSEASVPLPGGRTLQFINAGVSGETSDAILFRLQKHYLGGGGAHSGHTV